MSNSSNLQAINQEEAFNLCRFYTRIGQNVLLMGQRGVGKTQIAVQAILDNGYKVNYLNLSVLDRCDLLGFPQMNNNEDVITYKSPHYLPILKSNQKVDTVLLLDEVDKCDSSITAPLLEILQFRTINGKKLNVAACILTGNMMGEGAYSNQISTALLDRAAKHELIFDFQKWREWAQTHQINDLILAFLEAHQDLVCGPLETTLIASPSPRGWTYASESIKQAHQNKITDVDTIAHIIAGFVGSAAALKFRTWYDYYRHFEQEAKSILDSGRCLKSYQQLDPTEKLIFCITTCYLAKIKILETTAHKKRIRILDNVCRYFNEQEVAKEIQLVALTNSFPFDVIARHKLYECKSFFDLVSKLQDGLKLNK